MAGLTMGEPRAEDVAAGDLTDSPGGEAACM